MHLNGFSSVQAKTEASESSVPLPNWTSAHSWAYQDIGKQESDQESKGETLLHENRMNTLKQQSSALWLFWQGSDANLCDFMRNVDIQPVGTWIWLWTGLSLIENCLRFKRKKIHLSALLGPTLMWEFNLQFTFISKVHAITGRYKFIWFLSCFIIWKASQRQIT